MANIYNLFKFLEDKKGKKVPFMYKVRRAPETLTPDDLIIKGDLVIEDVLDTITTLPDDLYVKGGVVLTTLHVEKLPENFTIMGDFQIHDVGGLQELPANLTVYGDLDMFSTELDLEDIPENLKIHGAIISDHNAFSHSENRQRMKREIEERGGFVKEGIRYIYR